MHNVQDVAKKPTWLTSIKVGERDTSGIDTAREKKKVTTRVQEKEGGPLLQLL
jgi:hypothetical protein